MPKKKGKSGNVKVVVRCRPLNSAESKRKEIAIVMIKKAEHQVQIYKPNEANNAFVKEPPREFTFDHVFGPSTKQVDFFEVSVKPIVNDAMEGFNGTIFAYGQTGTGKTFSMEGVPSDPILKGVMPRAFEHIFAQVALAPKNVEYFVRASFLEIFLNEVYDLLNKKSRKKMAIKEHPDRGVFVPGLHEFVVKTPDDMLKLLAVGQKARATGATAMNPGSSRSHSLLCVTIEAGETDENGNAHYTKGALNLVDLAGSERQKRTGATGQRLEEAKAINLSLAALGNVIKALVSVKKIYVPYRDSKLTRLLQDSLGGNSKTCMIAAIGPASMSYDQTMTTLRYADRAKQIKNVAKRNEDPKDAKLREMKDEIAALKARLASKGGVPMVKDPVTGEMVMEQQETITEEKIIEKVVIIEGELSEEELKRFQAKSSEEQKQIAAAMIKEKQNALRTQKKAEIEARATEDLLKKAEAQLQNDKEEMDKLSKMIEDREKQVLVGSDEISAAQREKAELERTERDLQERKQEQARLADELEEAKEAELYINEQYSSRADELRGKTKTLKRIWNKFCEKKSELSEVQKEWDLEQDDLLDAIRTLDNQIRLKQLILDSFIPLQYQQLIENQAHYDTYNDEWSISGVEYAINNVHGEDGDAKDKPAARPAEVGFRRREPTPARLASFVGHLIPQTTNRYGQPELPHEVHEAINTALHSTEPTGLSAPPANVFYRYGVQKKSRRKNRNRD